MQAFIPQKIILENSVADFPLSRRVVRNYPEVPLERVESCQAYKAPAPITAAKKVLALVEHRGEAVKPFPKIAHAVNLGDFVFNPVSNCHLECTYCILQSYLKNNPVITVFANSDYFLAAIQKTIASRSDKTWRFGTGELSDSLALDDITKHSAELVPFFARLPQAYLELKTKSDCIAGLLSLEHRGRSVISWSLAPEKTVQQEELKCASLQSRLQSARQVQSAGYPVGLHLDPLIYSENWQTDYASLVEAMAQNLDPRRVAWVSVGSLRFDKALKEIATQRFPNTRIFSEDFIASPDGKMRYFKSLRMEMYREVWRLLREWSAEFPRYLCMEPPWMWEEVTGAAPDPEEVEARLVNRLKSL